MFMHDLDQCGQYWRMGFFWWFFGIILVMAIVVFLAPIRLRKTRHLSRRPLEILQELLVKGEVSVEEYEKRKAIIERDYK